MHPHRSHPAEQVLRLTFAALCLVLLSGCQSLSSTASSARVRIIDLSPDTLPMDVYQGNTAVAYNLSFGTVTSYVPVAPGALTFTLDSAGSRQVLSVAEGTFAAGTQYTVLVSNSITNLQQQILTDRGWNFTAKAPLPPSLRVVNQAPRTGAIDIYLLPAGKRLTSTSPIVTNLAPGANTVYLTTPTCACTTVILPAGTVPSAATVATHTGAQINYTTGSARTLILLDPQADPTSGPQVITTIDAEPLS